MTAVTLHPEVAEALDQGRPVVALETAVLTCGLPRSTWQADHGDCPEGIDPASPLHLATSRLLADTVRTAGAVPATCAIVDGQPMVGLDDATLEHLAMAAPAKAAPESTALHCAAGTSAGTTVGGTLMLLRQAASIAPPVRWFATGGIGGVHRNWQDHLDVSADLGMLARTPVGVVCAGAKSILDVHATAEALQTLGVPVLGMDTTRMPAFLSTGADDAPPVTSTEHPAAIAQAHWTMGGGGVLCVQDPPIEAALDRTDASTWADAAEAGVRTTGPMRTPDLLQAMATISKGATLQANIAVLVANARSAAALARSAV